MTTTTVIEVGALLRLRWLMIRRASLRSLVLAGALLTAAAVLAAPLVAPRFPSALQIEMATLLVTLLVLFPLLAFMAGMSLGGGAEAVPGSQVTMHPISARAVFVISVILTPLNIAWALQALTILWLASYVGSQFGNPWQGLALAGGYIVAATVLGSALSWFVTGIRSSWLGRRATEGLIVALLTFFGWRLARDGADQVLEALPLSELAVAVLLPDPTDLALSAMGLLLATAIGLAAGFSATRWALTRRDDAGDRREGRDYRRRPWRKNQLLALLSVDAANVMRSRPVRRGLVLFTIVPGVAALVSAMPWQDLVILPGLVATGAALLFSVNSFSLDGSGSAWLESCPRRPAIAFLSKATIAAGVITIIATGTMTVASARPRSLPEGSTITVLLLAVASAVCVSTAVAMRQSIRRPHKADLRAARDTPAPPVTMTLHSLRLIIPNALVGIAFVAAVRLPSVWPAILVTLLVGATSMLHLLWSARLWLRAESRSSVVAQVSYG